MMDINTKTGCFFILLELVLETSDCLLFFIFTFLHVLTYFLFFINFSFFLYCRHTDEDLFRFKQTVSSSAPPRRRPLVSVSIELAGNLDPTHHIQPNSLDPLRSEFIH